MDLHRAVEACTEAAIMASTGNSGTALSSFFVTLCAALEGKSSVSVSEFAAALRSTGGTIGSAFPPEKVKEGTIVSVIRKSVQLNDDDCSSLNNLAIVWESRAFKAMYETPDELEVDGHFILKEAAEKVSQADICERCPIDRVYQKFVRKDSVLMIVSHSEIHEPQQDETLTTCIFRT